MKTLTRFYSVLVLAICSLAYSQLDLEITYPLSGSIVSDSNLKIKLITKGNTEDLNYEIFLDGQPLAKNKDAIIEATGDSTTLTVPLPDSLQANQEFQLNILAQSTSGQLSQLLPLNLIYQPSTRSTSRLFLLAVGIDRYEDSNIGELYFASGDSQDFAYLFRNRDNLPFDEVDIVTLSNSQATLEKVLTTLEEWQREALPSDTVILFFSGHGFNDEEEGYFIPLYYSVYGQLTSTALKQAELVSFMQNTQASVLMFIDTCHAGAVAGTSDTKLSVTDGLVESLSQAARQTKGGSIKAVLAASQGGEVAIESPEWRNGAFTQVLLEGFNEGRASDNGQVSLLSLATWTSRQVPTITNGIQKPFLQYQGTDTLLWSSGAPDWEAEVCVEGVGFPPENVPNAARRRWFALKAAKAEAKLLLTEWVNGDDIESLTVVSKGEVADDEIRTSIKTQKVPPNETVEENYDDIRKEARVRICLRVTSF